MNVIPAASQLQRQLRAEGFAVLAVIADPADADWFTVYVQGPYGNHSQEPVFDFLVALPRVRDVRVSEMTSSILRVYREPDAGA
jgi:hypothetical protein